MPSKEGRLLFEAQLVRRDRKTGTVISRKQVYTQAVSKDQAERFIIHRNPGYSITRIVEK